MKNKPKPKTTQHQKPTKTHPETTLHVCLIYMPRTGHLLAVHPYPLKRWSQDIPGPTLDMQALDATWKLSGKYFLLKYSIPFLTPSRNIKACLEEWKCSTTFSFKLKISKLCWLRASVSETCLLCRQFFVLVLCKHISNKHSKCAAENNPVVLLGSFRWLNRSFLFPCYLY